MVTLYFYVHKKSVKEVQKYGYLSLRAQYETFKTLPEELLEEYRPRLERADEKRENFKEMTASMNESERVLFLIDHEVPALGGPTKFNDAWIGLDKSDPKTTSALQFLYGPIPNDPVILEYVRKTCHFDLENYVLFSYDGPLYDVLFEYKSKTYKHVVGNQPWGEYNEIVLHANNYWIKAWKKAMRDNKKG